ncbi:hypothetical protein [Aliikangiella maris]|uniref:Uncharacterized protein n=2 Tax=Aliikangiella maris TaxID=3162458 RepID=A0ABV2BY17_9GAMM
MSLLKSLLCLQGMDNGRRFLVVYLSAYLLFLIFQPLLEKSVVLFAFYLIIALPVIISSALRRIRDAGIASMLAAVPSLFFLIAVSAITFKATTTGYTFLILSVLVTAGLTVISHARARRKPDYTMGYAGPVNLQETEVSPVQNPLQRIEPTLAVQDSDRDSVSNDGELLSDQVNKPNISVAKQSESNHDESVDEYQIDIHANEALTNLQHSLQLEAQMQDDKTVTDSVIDNRLSVTEPPLNIEKKIEQWFLGHQKLASVIAISVVVILFLMVWLLTGDSQDRPEKNAQTPATKPQDIVKVRLHKLLMPDNYWLMLDENDALTIAWQGNVRDDGEYWSLASAKGDKDCLDIWFDNGEKYRSLLVTSKNNGDYYADFSPVDTANIIQSIALRSRFKLCGIEFSLKGTQAKLMSKEKYRQYIDVTE